MTTPTLTDQQIHSELTSREQEFSPEFLAWLIDNLSLSLSEYLNREKNTPAIVKDSVSTLVILHSLHLATLEGQGAQQIGGVENVARATRIISQLGGSWPETEI